MQWIKDIQTFGPNRTALEGRGETKIKKHNTNYLWIIHDYDFHQGNLPKTECLKSPLFSAATYKQCKWHLEVYPNGNFKSNITKKNEFSLYLRLDSTSECKTAFAYFKLFVLKENKEIECCRKTPKVRKFETNKDNASWGWSEFIRNDYELSPDKKLIVYCEVEIFTTDNFTNVINHPHSGGSVSLPKDLRQLLKNEKRSDVVISVNGKDFKAHKLILSSRSPVFAAMFEHEDMKENQQNKVVIDDFDEPIVEEMLNYIYTDRVENLSQFADNLLMIAEKYGLSGLKEMCEDTLANNLSPKNATVVLIMADLHHANKLRSNALNFIVEKFAQVMETPAWKNIVVSHPQLVIEVCDALSCRYRNSEP